MARLQTPGLPWPQVVSQGPSEVRSPQSTVFFLRNMSKPFLHVCTHVCREERLAPRRAAQRRPGRHRVEPQGRGPPRPH